MERLITLLGVVLILCVSWLWSSRRGHIPYRIIAWGLALQTLLVLFVLQVPFGASVFSAIGESVTWFLSFANHGAQFLFGNLASWKPEHQTLFGVQFALTIVPIIVFVSSVTAILYHTGVIQRVVRAMAWVMQRTMGTSAIESLAAAANVFLGQTEAPLLIRHYLPRATSSELFAIMVGGFATIAGSIMGVYIALGIPATYLIVASLIAAPGSLVLAKIAEPNLVASDDHPVEVGDPVLPSTNMVDALARGAIDGFKIAANVVVVLLAFTALVALVDASLAWSAEHFVGWGWQGAPHSLDQILAFLFYPFAWITGVPQHEVATLSSLLGVKISQTEFLAYEKLADLIASGELSQRTVTIATVALCGFANVMSIGIQIGGFGIMVPEKRGEVARLAVKAMCIGALANLMAACIVGVFA